MTFEKDIEGTGTDIETQLSRQAQKWNDSGGTLSEVNCPRCKNKGYIMLKENGILLLKECVCMKKRRILGNAAASGLSAMLPEYTFKNFADKEEWQKDVKQKALRFAAAVYEGGQDWFFIGGQTGSGKTQICTAICGDMLKREKSVRYMSWRSDSAALKGKVKEIAEYTEMIEPFKSADVLFIDDLYKCGSAPTPADVNLAYEIINHRYASRKTTIISSEYDIRAVIDIDEAVGYRIYERAQNYSISLCGEEKNIRARKAENK